MCIVHAASIHYLLCFWCNHKLRRWTWMGDFKCREVKTGFYRNRSMQTGSSGTLIGWKSGQTTFVPLWDWMEGAWLRALYAKYSHYPTLLQKPFTEDPASEGSNILVWFGSLCVLPSPWMYCEAHLGTVGVPFYENWRGRGVFTRNGKTSLVHYRTLSFFAFGYFLNAFSSTKPLLNLFALLC